MKKQLLMLLIFLNLCHFKETDVQEEALKEFRKEQLAYYGEENPSILKRNL